MGYERLAIESKLDRPLEDAILAKKYGRVGNSQIQGLVVKGYAQSQAFEYVKTFSLVPREEYYRDRVSIISIHLSPLTSQKI